MQLPPKTVSGSIGMTEDVHTVINAPKTHDPKSVINSQPLRHQEGIKLPTIRYQEADIQNPLLQPGCLDW